MPDLAFRSYFDVKPFHREQRTFSVVASIVPLKSKLDLVTPLLKTLQWLSIWFKLEASVCWSIRVCVIWLHITSLSLSFSLIHLHWLTCCSLNDWPDELLLWASVCFLEWAAFPLYGSFPHFFSGPHSISATHCGFSRSPCLKLQSSRSHNSFYSLFCCFLPLLTNLTTVQYSFNSFLVVFLGIPRYSTNIICKQWQFYFFSNLNSFSFSSVIAVLKTSKVTILD